MPQATRPGRRPTRQPIPGRQSVESDSVPASQTPAVVPGDPRPHQQRDGSRPALGSSLVSPVSVPRAAIISLIGAGGTGKTTTWEICRRRYLEEQRIEWIPEVARSYFTEHPETVDRFGFSVQEEIQRLVLARERAAHTTAECVVSDRCVLDAVAYVWSTGDHDGSRELLDRVSPWLPAYRTILLCSPDRVAFASDHVRTEDAAARTNLQGAFVQVLADHRIPHVVLDGTVDQRADHLSSEIAEALGSSAATASSPPAG